MFPEPATTVIERLRRAGRVQRIPTLSPEEGADVDDEPLELIGPVPMPLTIGGREVLAEWYVAAAVDADRRTAEHCDHVSAIVFGDPAHQFGAPLVRVHSTCFTGDVLGSLRCDCGPQLESALRQVSASEAGGMVVYVAAHEGRGIGLWWKAAAYLLQDEGLDTYEANRALGFPNDLRDFRHAASLIHYLLGGRPFRLLTNNPDKLNQMRALGIGGVVQQSHVAGVGKKNRRYVGAKRAHGHWIPDSVLTEPNG